jgi:tetratricopeptide (TPR) repeat protein
MVPDPLTISRLMEAATAHHGAGRLKEAEAIYRQVLEIQPGNAEALHRLGLIAGQFGRLEDAEVLIRQTIAAAPGNATFHCNLGIVQQRRGQLDQAIASYQRALGFRSDYASAHYNLGIAWREKGQIARAIDCHRRALELKPDYAEAHNELGNDLAQTGQLDQAIASYQKAIAIQPDFAEAIHNLGSAYKSRGRIDEAIACYQRSLELKPGWSKAHNHLGNAFKSVGRFDEAIACYQRALALNPTDAEVHNNLGVALAGKGQIDQAIVSYMRALHLRPTFAGAYYNLGRAFEERGEVDRAIQSYRQAIVIDKNLAEAYNNLAGLVGRSGRDEDALALYRRAIQISPNCAEYHWNLALRLLASGQFEEGWEEFEWRLNYQALGLRRDFTPPQWHGENLAGKTLLMHVEGGYGDAIQFIRYAPLLRGRAGKLILECQLELVRLFSGLDGIDAVIARGQELPEFDYQIPLIGLPRVFKTDLTNIPSAVPYLKALPDDLSRWRDRLKSDGRLKVGLAWAGRARPGPSDGRTRSVNIFESLARLSGAQFFSLQKGPESRQPRPAGLNLTDFMADVIDFADTAALIQQLDLVITVDSAVAHLAGALAKPVWVLIPFVVEIRWLMERSDSPWYPTMRLFRHPPQGDWQTPMHQIAEELSEWLIRRSPAKL